MQNNLRETGYWIVFRVISLFQHKKIKIRELGIEKDGKVELQVIIREDKNYLINEVEFLQENDQIIFIANAEGIVHLRKF